MKAIQTDAANMLSSDMKSHASGEQDFVYHIDGRDRLCHVSESWARFAMANDGASAMPERVLDRTLWDFIEDSSIRELYRPMVNRVRAGYPARFDYRCDAPEWRRQFRMTIRPLAGGIVEFSSQLKCLSTHQYIHPDFFYAYFDLPTLKLDFRITW